MHLLRRLKLFFLNVFIISLINASLTAKSIKIADADTTDCYGIFMLNGGPCGLLEHDASSHSCSNASFSELTRHGVSCISLGTSNYNSEGWGGNGIINQNKYLYFMFGPITSDFIFLLRPTDQLSLKAKRIGHYPDSLAVYYVNRHSQLTLLLKTYLTDQFQSYSSFLPEDSIDVISSIRFYAWGSGQTSSDILSGILSVDDVQLTFGISSLATNFYDDTIHKVKTYKLFDNFPNPFNPSTTIQFSIPEESDVTLRVYDVLGNEMATLVGEYKSAGEYEVEFDASALSSGIYFYKLQSGVFTKTKKMILVR